MMKRIYRLCALFAALLAAVMLLSGCTGFDESGFSDGVQIYYSSFHGYAYAGEYMWDGDPTQAIINVPDEFNGYPVEQLGGYYGTGLPIVFGIYDPSMDDQSIFAGIYDSTTDAIYDDIYYSSEPPVLSASDATIRLMTVTVNLGCRVSRIEETLVHQTIYKEDDENAPIDILGYLYSSPEYIEKNVFFLPVYYFVCAEDNATYYSEDGRLYQRNDNALVDAFTYWDSELLEYIPLSDT